MPILTRGSRLIMMAMLTIIGVPISQAQAGFIPAGAAGVASISPVGAATVVVGPTVALNNDNTTLPSPNLVNINKVFTGTPTPIDIVFNVQASGGVTEYFFSETIANLSLVNFTGYQLLLGTGTGANFVLASPTGPLDFDAPTYDPAPFSATFTTVATQPNMLTFSNGLLGIGAPATALTFSVDVPDGITQFTLRQAPIAAAVAIPEPSSMVLVGLGALGLVGIARRRRKA